MSTEQPLAEHLCHCSARFKGISKIAPLRFGKAERSNQAPRHYADSSISGARTDSSVHNDFLKSGFYEQPLGQIKKG